MRFFASSHRLVQLAPRTRWLLLGLLAFLALQLCSGIAMHHAGPGWSGASVAAHYGAPDLAAASPATDPFGGLNGFGSAPPPPSAPPDRGLAASSIVETAHIHLAIMPLVVFTVAHVFAMTGLGRRRFSGLIAGVAYLGVLGDVGFPFLVREFGALWAWPKLLAFWLLVGGLAFMLAWCAGAVLASFRSPRRSDRDGAQ